MKRVLMIAYHFPPLAGSSGIQRTLRFVRHLPEFGWEPIVLTAHRRAYEQTSPDQVPDIPEGIQVVRTQAWDTARHLAIAGRYPAFLARPDRWVSWMLSAAPAGLRLVRQARPHAIWSTYPIATAHRIGEAIARRSGLPWVADFRDPMAQDGYPSDPATWRSYERIERSTVESARFSTFTTPSAVQLYRDRYPPLAERFALLENGYDEDTFAAADGGGPLNPGKLTLLHSGLVYPLERNPAALFSAMGQLRSQDPLCYGSLRLRFRAPVHIDLLTQLAKKEGIEDAVEILPSVPYREALSEMLRADALLILQASNCNAQVPAKLYEYLRARRPVLLLTDPVGDTAKVAQAAGITTLAPLNSANEITALLRRFVGSPRLGSLPSEEAIANASRQGRTRALASLLDRAVSPSV